jgi:hypothetical protein
MNIKSIFLRWLCAAALLLTTTAGSSADHTLADAAAVRQVLMTQFDRPQARLRVDPVAISGDAAVAAWSQGERGGRALLFRKVGQWQIALCAGDALKQARVMREAGVPSRDADVIARTLSVAEAKLPAAERARFSTFDGVVRMDAGGAHPPGHRQ